MKPGFLTKPVYFRSISQVDRMLFIKHLSVMLKSGITAYEAVSTLAEENPNARLRRILSAVAHDLRNGQPLHQALGKFPEFFDPISLHLIRIGEDSGTLEANLEFLTDQLQRSYDTRRKIAGALLYPEVVLMTALVVSAGVSFFVLPQMGDLFRELDVPLPLTTRFLLFLSDTTRDFGLLILALILLLALILRWLVNTPAVKPHWHAFVLSLPLFGPLIRNYELSAFCRNLGIMLKSGLPILLALEAQRDNTANLVFRSYASKLRRSVERGKTLEDTLEQANFTHFPLLAIRMIGVGERSGRLDEALLYLADFYEDEAENTAKNLTNILEPIMLLIVGLAVAFVALSIISPIYELSGSIRPGL